MTLFLENSLWLNHLRARYDMPSLFGRIDQHGWLAIRAQFYPKVLFSIKFWKRINEIFDNKQVLKISDNFLFDHVFNIQNTLQGLCTVFCRFSRSKCVRRLRQQNAMGPYGTSVGCSTSSATLPRRSHRSILRCGHRLSWPEERNAKSNFEQMSKIWGRTDRTDRLGGIRGRNCGAQKAAHSTPQKGGHRRSKAMFGFGVGKPKCQFEYIFHKNLWA